MIFQGSRYAHTSAYVRSANALITGVRDRVEFDLTNATYYTFIEGDTIDGIAYKLYNNATLWWAIMDANTKFQSEVEIKPGDILAIPPYEEVLSKL